jgi:amino acid permease
MLSGFIAYISQLIGYIVFHYKFPAQDRGYKSPLGVGGAVYGIAVFALASVGIIGFQDDGGAAVIAMVVLLCVYTACYYLYSEKNQYFSSDERFIFTVYMNRRTLT